MKKTFQLQVEGKHPERLLEAIKHDIRKYLKRERRRDLPEGADFWDFDCKFGLTEETANVVHLANVITCIDNAAKEQAQQFYVEILAKHGVRAKRPAGEAHEYQERHAFDGLDDGNND
jgi:Family of unknown function (DUF6172)